MSGGWTRRGLSATEAAIVRHPDQRSAWVVGAAIRVAAPGLERGVAQERLAALADAHPILNACRHGNEWVAGRGGLRLGLQPDDVLESDTLRARIDLTRQAPLRVRLTADGRTLVLACHHAALDGRALTLIAGSLLSDGAAPGDAEAPGSARPAVAAKAPGHGAAGGEGRLSAVRRLVSPADRVAPSATPASEEVLVAADIPRETKLRVAHVSAACVAAASEWNAKRSAPWRRIGLTIPVGGPDRIANVASHRRLDLRAGEDVERAVTAALAARDGPAPEPVQSRIVMQLLAPVVYRFSDSLLVSNLGRLDLPGAELIDFFPQARGRSAVAIGLSTASGHTPRLTVRARDMAEGDARALLAATIDHLTNQGDTT